jgi:hypothetical protein
MNFQRVNVSFALCSLLFLCIALTGLTGYLQVKLDIHRFVVHKYLAYSSLSLTFLHILINWKKVWGYVKRLLRL